MTASYNISFLGSPEHAESQEGKKGYRSSRYNNYMVEVVDFDNESHTFEVDARSEAEASECTRPAGEPARRSRTKQAENK